MTWASVGPLLPDHVVLSKFLSLLCLFPHLSDGEQQYLPPTGGREGEMTQPVQGVWDAVRVQQRLAFITTANHCRNTDTVTEVNFFKRRYFIAKKAVSGMCVKD